MCGIVGALAFGKLSKRDEKIRQRLMRYLTSELVLETEERGVDATGAAVLFTDGNYAGIKRGEESGKFLAKFGISKERYGSLLEIWRQHDHPAKVYLGHCRKGTIGDKEDNENNHPIKIKNIVGVHNGVIRNDEEIQKHMGCKRDGKVDSELIFRMFDHFTNACKEPFTMDMLEKVTARLTGAFAVLAFNADNLNQLPMFRDGRPLEMILIKDLSLMIIVSELKFWNRVHFRYERMIEYGEVKLPSLLDMKIEKKAFKDDSAVIFDLNIKCTEETEIEDLGEFKKIPRDNKVWTTTAALNTSNRIGTASYANGQKMAEDEAERKKAAETKRKLDEEDLKKAKNKEADGNKADQPEDTNKRRVFNNLTKRYETKGTTNPDKLDGTKSKIIPITSISDPGNKKETTSKLEEDQIGEETASNKLELEDLTDYTIEERSEKGEIDPKDILRDVLDAEFTEINEVDMSVVDPKLQAQADDVYKNLSDESRGYGDVETLLTDLNIKSEQVANELGLKIVSNRVAKVQWTHGFIAGWKSLMSKEIDTDEKTVVREKHIDGLKSLVIILAQFFSRSKSEGRKRSKKSDEALIQIAENHLSKRPSFSMEKLNGVFNDHETGKIKEAGTIITKVENS